MYNYSKDTFYMPKSWNFEPVSHTYTYGTDRTPFSDSLQQKNYLLFSIVGGLGNKPTGADGW